VFNISESEFDIFLKFFVTIKKYNLTLNIYKTHQDRNKEMLKWRRIKTKITKLTTILYLYHITGFLSKTTTDGSGSLHWK